MRYGKKQERKTSMSQDFEIIAYLMTIHQNVKSNQHKSKCVKSFEDM